MGCAALLSTALFQGVQDDDPIADVRAYLAEHDPDVLAQVAEVDRSRIRAKLQLSPLTRLVASAQQARIRERLAAFRSATKKNPSEKKK